ncbi:MAG: hypothetical protein HYS25_08435 [Ignavibacteriales bacterium]|nr:hypothetical protein [Ignavibacteriales bacterium]
MFEMMEKYSSVGSNNDSVQSLFYKLGKEHFQIDLKGEFDYINSIKESIRILSLELPNDLKEIYIPYSNAPVYWTYESWLLNQIEEYMRLNFARARYFDLHKSIKENYIKWVTSKLKNEKEYYANLAISFIERDVHKHNFFKLIIQAVIYLHHNSFYNPVKALELFTHAKELVNNSRLAANVKQELEYILSLYIGFVHFKEKQYEIANAVFKEALDIKANGITAKIYCALTEINLEHDDLASFYLKEVITYDFHRLTIAMDANNPGMFNYFFKNCFFYNVFYEKNFWKATNLIEQILQVYRANDHNALITLQKNIAALKAKEINKYLTEEISRGVSFLEKVAQNYSGSQNTMIIGLYPELEKKYNGIVHNLVKEFKRQEQKEIESQLAVLDEQIRSNQEAEKHLHFELENFKAKSREKLNKAIQNINDEYENNARGIEDRIINLPNTDRYNTQRSFSSNMAYNTILALMVAIIGGVASHSNAVANDFSDSNAALMNMIFGGLKWGVISFLVGGLLTLIIAALVLIDRSEEKQRLLRKLNLLKVQKNRSIQETKEYAEHKEKVMIENINNSLTNHRKNVGDLSSLRDSNRKELTELAEAKIKSFEESLENIE